MGELRIFMVAEEFSISFSRIDKSILKLKIAILMELKLMESM